MKLNESRDKILAGIDKIIAKDEKTGKRLRGKLLDAMDAIAAEDMNKAKTHTDEFAEVLAHTSDLEYLDEPFIDCEEQCRAIHGSTWNPAYFICYYACLAGKAFA